MKIEYFLLGILGAVSMIAANLDKSPKAETEVIAGCILFGFACVVHGIDKILEKMEVS